MAPKADPKAKAKAEGKKKAVKKEEKEEDQDRIPQPDKDAFKEAENKISEAIDKLQLEAKAFTDEINSRSGGKDEYNRKRSEIRAKLDEFSAKIDALMARKGEIQKAMGDKRQEGVEMRNELNKMKKSVGYTNEADIDERIAQIEKRMVTESIPLKEEKDLLKEISELKKRRPQVSRVKAMEGNLAQRDFGGDLKEQLSIINADMAQYRDGKRLVQDELKALMDGRNSQVGDLSDIFAKRDGVNEKIKAKIQERNELRDKFRAEEREFNNYLRQQREKRAAAMAEERAAKQAEWNKQKLIRAAEKLDEQPHISEMALIEQCMAFCKSLVATKDEDVKEEKKEIQHDLKQGEELLVKKEDRDEFFFVPTAKKKSKSKSKGTKAEGGSAKAIKHNAATFRLFDSLKLNAPITTDDIPATLEELDKQLDMYKEKVKEWEEKREDMKRKILEGIVEPEDAEEAKKDEAAEEPAAEQAES
eukprot:SRR837773.5487.p2 GENE.SRR837773.5487~~SRR837773.5487.p2  ORF type:complete len:493 (+),score=345.42 SRR837773.5487:56-1480(+)